jgi:hypothetical protein
MLLSRTYIINGSGNHSCDRKGYVLIDTVSSLLCLLVLEGNCRAGKDFDKLV